jgi:cell wall-associated NlpC family hydrolase
MRALAPLLIGLALLSGCASFGERGPAESPQTEALRQTLVLEALGQIGRPYRYGGSTPEGFDCSGLVQYVYAQAGIALPRTTGEQYRVGRRINLEDAQPGDLLFYRFSGGRKIDHVAPYLGDGQALHAPARGRTVIVAGVAERYWMERMAGAVRVLGR